MEDKETNKMSLNKTCRIYLLNLNRFYIFLQKFLFLLLSGVPNGAEKTSFSQFPISKVDKISINKYQEIEEQTSQIGNSTVINSKNKVGICS